MHSDGLVSWFGILARHETTRQAWLRVDRRGNIFDFWGRNMKTFPGKSSQRPLIRSGSEWPLYLGLDRMKAFLAGERDPCTTSAMSTRLETLNLKQIQPISVRDHQLFLQKLILPSNHYCTMYSVHVQYLSSFERNTPLCRSIIVTALYYV